MEEHIKNEEIFRKKFKIFFKLSNEITEHFIQKADKTLRDEDNKLDIRDIMNTLSVIIHSIITNLGESFKIDKEILYDMFSLTFDDKFKEFLDKTMSRNELLDKV